MKPYSAPLADMRFVLRNLVESEALCQLPNCEFVADPELMDEILEQAARFASEVLWPLDVTGDRQGARWTERGVIAAPGFAQAYRRYVEAGWHSIDVSAEHGGQDLPAVLCSAIHEMFVAANKAFCMCPDLAPAAIKAIAAAAGESLKSLYIPKLVSGEWSATMDLTEPHAGSDVGALRTRAEPRADGTYRLFGQKVFISFGDHDLTENIVHLVLARVLGAPEGSKGISLFIVPKVLPDGRRNDILCTGIERKLGNHASPTCALAFGGRGDGAVGWLVGQENCGLKAMFAMMNPARLNVGIEGLAVSERAYQQARTYARERVQGRLVTGGGSVTIINHPDVRRMLLMMRSQIEAMRAMAYHISAVRHVAERHPDPAERRVRQAFLDLAIPVFKGWATETAVEIASTSIQVHGGAGYVEDNGVTQPLRDVRVTTIYEGTTSIQAQDLVDRKLVRDGGAAFRAWFARAELTLADLAGSDSGQLNGIERKLRIALARLSGTVERAIAEYPKRPLEVLAGSVPLLRLFGVVLGGWHMGRSALSAHRHLELGDGDAAFLGAKIASASFYACNILPQAAALSEAADEGGSSVMAIEESAI